MLHFLLLIFKSKLLQMHIQLGSIFNTVLTKSLLDSSEGTIPEAMTLLLLTL
jgi:hypothetical protein